MIEVYCNGGEGRSDRVMASSIRLSEDRLMATIDDEVRDVAYWDVLDRQWHRPDGDSLRDISITSPDPARELLLEMVEQDDERLLTATSRDGRLLLPGCQPGQFAHLQLVGADGEIEQLAFSFLIGSWDTGNDGWPKRATGDIVVRQGGQVDLEPWDGAIGVRVRPSALAERRV
jgi:hypothetical protein